MSTSCSTSLPSGALRLSLKLLAGLEHLGRGTAGNDGLELAPFAQAAAERGIEDQLAEW